MATRQSDTCASKRIGPGSITLEALLDSPSLSPLSPSSETLNGACVVSNSGPVPNSHTQPAGTSVCNSVSVSVSSSRTATCNQSESNAIHDEVLAARRKVCMRDVCMELLTVLRSQDIHGYFLSPKVYTSCIGLLELEKRVMRSKYASFKLFQTDVFKSINVTAQNYAVDPLLYNEGQRLVTLASDWFASLPQDLLKFLTPDSPNLVEDSFPSAAKARSAEDYFSSDLGVETHLRVLNPDNQGMIGPNECVLTLGEEDIADHTLCMQTRSCDNPHHQNMSTARLCFLKVGPLRCGTGLLPHGGYREDRRNKVVPYTYLDYGPYYTFAPRFDSGASHCTPEANQLVLGTSWLPSRLAHLSPSTAESQPCPEVNHDRDDEACDDANENCHESLPEDDNDIAKALSSELVSAALASGDQALAVSLAVCEMDQIATGRLSDEVMELLPGPEVEDESCVFALCLANAFTRDWVRDRRKLDRKELPELSCDLDSMPETGVSVTTTVEPSEEIGDHQSSGKTVEDIKVEKEVSLEDTAADLRRLQQAQYRRLGQSPQVNPDTNQVIVGTAWQQLQPSREELTTAHRLAGGLARLLGRASPRDVVHPYALRRAMGLSPNCAPLERE